LKSGEVGVEAGVETLVKADSERLLRLCLKGELTDQRSVERLRELGCLAGRDRLQTPAAEADPYAGRECACQETPSAPVGLRHHGFASSHVGASSRTII
jgi:hypothetical protein